MHRRDMFAILPRGNFVCVSVQSVYSNQACQDKMGVFIGLFISRRITRQVEFILYTRQRQDPGYIIETYT